MRCSRCGMPLSPTGTSCPRCRTAVTRERVNRQEELPFASVQVQSEYSQRPFSEQSPGFVGVPVEIAPAQQWSKQVRETPFAVAMVPLTTPSALRSEGLEESSHTPDAKVLSAPSPLLSREKRSLGIGFGLAGLCTGIACLLLLFVYVMIQSLPQVPNSLSTHSTGGLSSLTTQNTPTVNLSPTAIAPTASTTPTYPGQRYFANAKTASAVNATTAQTLTPTTTFRVGQTIFTTFDVYPNGQTGAVCLLWFINGAQFTSYPFALKSTSTTAAYSYASTGTMGSGYIEMYWENAPSCTDPNKILGAHVDFTVTA